MIIQLTPESLKKKIEETLPGTKAKFSDLTGTADHWQAVIVSEAFKGKTLIEQHRIVKDVFDAEIQAGHLHALTIRTYSPEEWEKFGKAKDSLE
jgi:stress-induced morphogen